MLVTSHGFSVANLNRQFCPAQWKRVRYSTLPEREGIQRCDANGQLRLRRTRNRKTNKSVLQIASLYLLNPTTVDRQRSRPYCSVKLDYLTTDDASLSLIKTDGSHCDQIKFDNFSGWY